MSGKVVMNLAQGLMYLVMFSVLIAMLHNAWFNKNLNVTTPCDLTENEGGITRPVWEILGYGENVSRFLLEREDVDEYERLMQSCLSWQHNYNFINYRIIPAIGLMFVALLMKQNPRFFARLPQYIKRAIKEADNEGKEKKPPTYGFGKT